MQESWFYSDDSEYEVYRNGCKSGPRGISFGFYQGLGWSDGGFIERVERGFEVWIGWLVARCWV